MISMEAFATDWAAHIPISSLCERYTVTKDQVIRLKTIWKLPPRHDRALRAKPRWAPRPSPGEESASGQTCDLAPDVARRIAELKASETIRGTPTRRDDGVVRFEVPVIPNWRDFTGGVDFGGD